MNGQNPRESEWSDADYVESSRNGCPDHYRLLVQRYQRPLFAYVMGRLGDETDAEEAAQESFVRGFLLLKKLRKPESFYSWLIGIAAHVLQERFRATARRHRLYDAVANEPTPETSSSVDYPIEEALAALPESYRQVVLLRYYEGLSCQEIAEYLGLPLGTVTKTLSRAYAMLRADLKARENTETSTPKII